MRVTGYEVGWRDDFEDATIERILAEVGGAQVRYEHDVSEYVDAKLLIISSECLTPDQLEQVWEAGDLGVADGIFEGTFDEILAQLRKNLDEETD